MSRGQDKTFPKITFETPKNLFLFGSYYGDMVACLAGSLGVYGILVVVTPIDLLFRDYRNAKPSMESPHQTSSGSRFTK